MPISRFRPRRPVVLTLAATAFLGAQLVVPVSTRFSHLGGGAANPRAPAERALEAGPLRPPAEVDGILRRSCADCHSYDTRWPWYSHVAPMSWLVIDHVNHGREHWNLSTFNTLPPSSQRRLLDAACRLATRGAMPLPSYLLVHRSARLSAADVDALCAWTSGARVSPFAAGAGSPAPKAHALFVRSERID